MRLLLLLILIFTSVAMVGCRDNDSPKKLKSHNARSLDEAKAYFFHIQASYEIISTGELIDFDFIQSCYNRDVVGSFHGIVKPVTMFKATFDGGAIGITPPQRYCSSGLKPRSNGYLLQPVPIMMLYRDVNDLSYGYTYVSAHAYHNANAEVKLVNYEASRTTRAAFHEWVEKAEAEYQQIGGIPGPFGCRNDSVGDNPDDNCRGPVVKAKNNNKGVIVPHGLRYAQYIYFPDGLTEAYKPFTDLVKSSYTCFNSEVKDEVLISRLDIEENLKKPTTYATVLGKIQDQLEVSEAKKVRDARKKVSSYLINHSGFADLPTVKSEATEIRVRSPWPERQMVPIDDIYSVILYWRGEPDVHFDNIRAAQIIENEMWRGIMLQLGGGDNSVPGYESPLPGIKDFLLPASAKGIYINKQRICNLSPYGYQNRKFRVYDWVNERVIVVRTD